MSPRLDDPLMERPFDPHPEGALSRLTDEEYREVNVQAIEEACESISMEAKGFAELSDKELALAFEVLLAVKRERIAEELRGPRLTV